MKKARLLPALLLCLLASGCTVQSVGVATPEASVRVSVSAYPDLVLVPGSPVYYAPWVDQNYFFYDGMYWVFQGDNWYASYWFNGPWDYVRVDYVPLFILRVPVYYYRRPPVYFRSWRAGEPPRWGERWGHDWEARHPDWRRHDGAMPPPAPRPDYQRGYNGRRYPAPAQQQQLRQQHYSYQPRERVELSRNPRQDKAQESWQQQQQQWQQRRQQQEQQQQERQDQRQPRGPMRQDGRPLRDDDREQDGRGREQRDADRQRLEQWRQQRENDQQVQEQWRQRPDTPFREPGRQRPDLNPPPFGQERRERQDERQAQDEARQRQEQSRQWQERQQREQAAQQDPRGQGREPQWPAPRPQRPDIRGDSPRFPSPDALPRGQRDAASPAETAPRAPQWQGDVRPAPSRREFPVAPAIVPPAQDRSAPAAGSGEPGQDARPGRKEAPSRKSTRGQPDEEPAQQDRPGR